MKLFALSVFVAFLAIGWQPAALAEDSARAIERAELARSFDATLAAGLDASDEATRVRAALAIGRTKKSTGTALLRAHLAANDPALRAMCAYALGLIADLDALPLARALARTDSSSAVRYAAIDAVGRIALAHPLAATRAVANDTIIVARTDRDSIVRAHAAAQLDVFKEAAIRMALAPWLEQAVTREKIEAVRWHLAWAIFRNFAHDVTPGFLASSLHDRNELVRVEAARALGRRGDPRGAAILESALDDPSWRVQLEARESLLRLAKRPPTEHLTALPPGLHLPPIPAAAAASMLVPVAASAAPPASASSSTHTSALSSPSTPAPSPPPTSVSSSPSTSPSAPSAATVPKLAAPKLAAPDPATFPLAPMVTATDASDFAAPAHGPHPRVRIVTTKGDLVVRLYPEWAPSTVANFLSLAAKHYFDGNRWFRIVPDFVVQTGDPNDNGEGDAGYMIPAEENPLEERAGAIAMGLNYDANGAQRDSAGTQFYIDLSPQLHLDRDFSVFGEVSSGFDVLAHLIESDRMLTVTRIADG